MATPTAAYRSRTITRSSTPTATRASAGSRCWRGWSEAQRTSPFLARSAFDENQVAGTRLVALAAAAGAIELRIDRKRVGRTRRYVIEGVSARSRRAARTQCRLAVRGNLAVDLQPVDTVLALHLGAEYAVRHGGSQGPGEA